MLGQTEIPEAHDNSDSHFSEHLKHLFKAKTKCFDKYF